MNHHQRGHIVLLMMTMLMTALVAGTIVANRISRSVEDRAFEEVRTQALWLARSALDVGVAGTRTVRTEAGTATVRATPGSVVVELEGMRATVTASPPTERFAPLER